MRRHPGAIRREQRAMSRSRTALRGMRRILDVVGTTGGKVTTEKLEPAPGVCGATRDGYTCDREPGHTGHHRSYNEQIDEPIFWTR